MHACENVWGQLPTRPFGMLLKSSGSQCCAIWLFDSKDDCTLTAICRCCQAFGRCGRLKGLLYGWIERHAFSCTSKRQNMTFPFVQFDLAPSLHVCYHSILYPRKWRASLSAEGIDWQVLRVSGRRQAGRRYSTLAGQKMDEWRWVSSCVCQCGWPYDDHLENQ
jgi:hypothetical protein